MRITHQGQENVKADFNTVWDFISDAQNVSQCLPDVERIDIKSDKHFDAIIRVNLGPLQGRLKFAITLLPKPEQRKILVNMHGGGPGVNIDLKAEADIHAQPQSTLLDWKGQADVRGPATIMGGRMLETKARNILAHVFSEIGKNLNARL